MTLLADVVVLHKLTTVRRSYPLLDFAQKLLLVAQHALYRFHDQSFTVAPLFHSSARQLLLQRRIESYFHAARLKIGASAVNSRILSNPFHPRRFRVTFGDGRIGEGDRRDAICLTKLTNSRQLLPTTPLPRLTFE
jgi:hypothetical protein